MTTKLKWRLANRPTPNEVQDLFTSGLLTKDESREILFSLETEEDRDKQSLQEEIKFLRQLVQSLSSQSKIVEHIYKYQNPYQGYQWWQPYQAYCSTNSVNAIGGYTSSLSGTTTTLGIATPANNLSTIATSSQPSNGVEFTSIKTF